MIALWLVATAAIACLLTGWLRQYALSRQVLDVPNERSSHAVVTPRGGGMAIALTFIGAAVIGQWLYELPWSFLVAACGLGALVALVGFMDDRHGVAPAIRLFVHFAAAGGAVALVYQGADLGAVLPSVPPWLAGTVAAVAMVWLLNLYNFMDGIDGIAGIEAITVCFGGALVFAASGSELWRPSLFLLGSVAGFLYWNFPSARIFMGDAGSGFLGFVLAVFCLQAATISAECFFAWIILLGVFVVDATVALFRRLIRGKRIYVAHRSHAYQHAAERLGAHAPVSLAVGAINLAWLLPLALLVSLSVIDWLVGVTIACLPLVYLALRFRSGVG